jgi:hypothetical protein
MMSVQVFDTWLMRTFNAVWYNFCDVSDATLSVRTATHMNDYVNSRINHVARILQSPTWCGLHSQQIKSVQTIYSRICVQGR